jgi:hypothetical protein
VTGVTAVLEPLAAEADMAEADTVLDDKEKLL